METKKLILILVIAIIAIIIVFKLALGSFKKDSIEAGVNGYVDREYQKQVEKVDDGTITGKYETYDKNIEYYNLTQEDRTDVDKCIDKVLEMFNNNSYGEMFSLVTDNYSSALFSTMDEFRDYIDDIKQNIDGQATAKNFSVLGNALSIKIADEKGHTTGYTFKVNNFHIIPPTIKVL